MIYGLVLTARARADILRNAEWWAENHSPDQALAWFDSIYEQLEGLRRMPERFPLAPENGSVEVEIREIPLGIGSRPSYRAVFTIKPLEVHVLTVRRASQDALPTEGIES
jgi:plasmid stabilization system protein ParE